MNIARCIPGAAWTGVAVALGLVAAVGADEPRRTTVGFAGRIEHVVLPGSELEATPLTDVRQPVVLRVVATFPHGTDFRYDLEYYGLEAGQFNLCDYLRRKDGTGTESLPALPVAIESQLPPGQIQPTPVRPQRTTRWGGYRLLLIAGGIGWLIGLAAILRSARQRRHAAAASQPPGPMSFADRLRPLVEAARNGQLSRSGQAELERLLLAYWRKRLGLEERPAVEALLRLRQHPEAGTLLQQLDTWLHRPGGAVEVDLDGLLAPYGRLAETDVSMGGTPRVPAPASDRRPQQVPDER